MLQDDFYFGVQLHKWSSVDRWDKGFIIPPVILDLSLEYENNIIEQLQSGERGDYLRIATRTDQFN